MGAGLIEANRTGGTVKKAPLRLGRARRCLRRVPRRRRADRPADRAGGPVRLLRRVHRRPLRRRRAPRRAGHPLGAAAHRLQALPVQPLHPPRHRLRPGPARRRPRPVRLWTGSSSAWPRPTLRTIAEPAAREGPAPQRRTTRKFSGPYTVATALLGGGGLGVGLDDFTGPLDPDRLALAAKVRCVADERATADLPARVRRGAAGPRRRDRPTSTGSTRPWAAPRRRCPPWTWPASSASTPPGSWAPPTPTPSPAGPPPWPPCPTWRRC